MAQVLVCNVDAVAIATRTNKHDAVYWPVTPKDSCRKQPEAAKQISSSFVANQQHAINTSANKQCSTGQLVTSDTAFDTAGRTPLGYAKVSQPSSQSSELCSTSGRDDWILPEFGGREVLSDFEFGMQLGRGSFGVTKVVTERCSARPYACKSISKVRISSAAFIHDLRREVKILQHLQGHSGVVQLNGLYEDQRSVHLVMELCTGGDLLDMISRRGPLSEPDAAAAMRCMLTTLDQCHAKGVIHRDVKPENFLLADYSCSTNIKASDFGVSTFFKPGQVRLRISNDMCRKSVACCCWRIAALVCMHA